MLHHTGYLFIGDIHGQSHKLHQLLQQRPPHSQILFIGDLIDNKPDNRINQLQVLQQVQQLVEQQGAQCLLGNHELNAIGWYLRHPHSGLPLRAHSDNNRKQHQAFLNEVGENSPLHQYWIQWLQGRPLYWQQDDLQAIHACWQQDAIDRLQPYINADRSLKSQHWVDAFDPQHELYALLEILLKGPELELPAGYSFVDKTGKTRRHIRLRWWLENASTYRDLAQVPPNAQADIPLLPFGDVNYQRHVTGTVVVGHYTLAGKPTPLSEQVICVDYNAAKADNPLVAYYWHPQPKLRTFLLSH